MHVSLDVTQYVLASVHFCPAQQSLKLVPHVTQLPMRQTSSVVIGPGALH